jgi:RimJ/RimL family protein N-acetyltransferase
MSFRVEVPEDSAAIEDFVRFHDRVYAGRSAFWPAFVPLEAPFVSGAGPVAESRRCRPFVARDAVGDVVARVLAVLDLRYTRHWNESLGHLVKFEAFPGTRAAVRGLMDRASEWLAEQGAVAARCGMGPLDMPFVVDAYDALPPSILRFNPPYYHALLKDAGFETEQGYVDYRIAVRPDLVAQWEANVAAAERRGFELLPLRSVPAERRAALLAALFNETFASHWGFAPVTELEQRTYLRLFETSGALDTSMIAFRGDEPLGEVTVVPETSSFATIAPGRTLLPSERLNWLGIGVRAPARGRGVNLALASAAFLELVRRGATHVSYTLVLDDNWPSRRTAERLGGEVCANYVAYRRNFRR